MNFHWNRFARRKFLGNTSALGLASMLALFKQARAEPCPETTTLRLLATSEDTLVQGDERVVVCCGKVQPGGTITSDGVVIDGGTLTEFIKSKNLRVVDSISALRQLSKLAFSRVLASGYYAAGDGGGGGNYWYDSTDTKSADNGGSVIVANDGGRWKLLDRFAQSLRQFGAKSDGVTNSQETALLRELRY